MSIPEIPAAPLDAAMKAAWPGLPAGISLEEAERRTRKAIQAAYPHLVDAQDKVIADATEAAARRVEDYANDPGVDDDQRRVLLGAAQMARGKGLDGLALRVFHRQPLDPQARTATPACPVPCTSSTGTAAAHPTTCAPAAELGRELRRTPGRDPDPGAGHGEPPSVAERLARQAGDAVSILDRIDDTLDDWHGSNDAMRWTPADQPGVSSADERRAVSESVHRITVTLTADSAHGVFIPDIDAPGHWFTATVRGSFTAPVAGWYGQGCTAEDIAELKRGVLALAASTPRPPALDARYRQRQRNRRRRR